MTDLTLFGDVGESTADLIDRYVHTVAVADLVAEVKAQVRDRLDVQADTIEAATGGAFNVKVPSVGQVYRTAPEAKPAVTDRTLLTGWFEQAHPEACRVRRTATFDESAAIDAYDHGDRVRLLDVILATFDVREETLLPEDPCGWLVDGGHAVLGTDGLHSTDDGQLIPGTGVKQARRQLTVKTDKGYRESLADQLRERFAPQLETSDA